jgi:methylenetetrahydrofolate dehydrogenase (NADP+)/methenyltetrahydrofolate cyclohydrolase
MQGTEAPVPCTPKGVMRLLDESGMHGSGKHAVVVGRSNIVGKPVAMLLLAQNFTVTICHSRTADLALEVSRADVVVAAVGVAKLIKGEWLKQGAVVLDVGINRGDDGKLVGDVDFDSACERASYITPVPGGVGPMTIAMLLSNTVEAAEQRLGI